MGAEDSFVGLIDLVKMQAIITGTNWARMKNSNPSLKNTWKKPRNTVRSCWKPLQKAMTI